MRPGGMQALAPPKPRLGFTPEQLTVLRQQILAFRKIKQVKLGHPLTLDMPLSELQPKPLPANMRSVNPLMAAAMAAASAAAAASKPGPGRPPGPLSQTKPGPKPKEAAKGVPAGPAAKGPAGPAAPAPAVLTPPAAPPLPAAKPIVSMLREVEQVPFKGPAPSEYRGNEIVARFDGPLMVLGDPMVEVPAPDHNALATAAAQFAAFKAHGAIVPGHTVRVA